jgi:hypothetical protein
MLFPLTATNRDIVKVFIEERIQFVAVVIINVLLNLIQSLAHFVSHEVIQNPFISSGSLICDQTLQLLPDFLVTLFLC